MFEESKVNISSTKYEIIIIKLHFMPTNDFNGQYEQTMMDGLGKKNSRLLQDGC